MYTSWESQLTPEELNVYKELFEIASKSKPNLVTGIEAVQFFAKSGLPNTILSEVIHDKFTVYRLLLIASNANWSISFCFFSRFGKMQTEIILAISH